MRFSRKNWYSFSFGKKTVNVKCGWLGRKILGQEMRPDLLLPESRPKGMEESFFKKKKKNVFI